MINYSFSSEELAQITAHGLTPKKVTQQANILAGNNFHFQIKSPAKIGKGIIHPTKAEREHLISIFEKENSKYEFVKFVPASGAATRMFKSLIKVNKSFQKLTFDELKAISEKDEDFKKTLDFLQNLLKFAFLKNMEIPKDNLIELLNFILWENGINLASLPKGLIAFHIYKDSIKNPVEEHIRELKAIFPEDENLNLHFTISQNHEKDFHKEFSKMLAVNPDISISYSFQHKSTDTIAIDSNLQIARNELGRIIFRPSGHGALLKNLNELDADFVIIKNIDNVIHHDYLSKTIPYHKLLMGMIIDKQNFIFEKVEKIESVESESSFKLELDEIEKSIHLNIPLHLLNESLKVRKEFILNKLKRPIRVCGMVKNEGEPGGGPFWVVDDDGTESLQIVELSQIDRDSEENKILLKESTHFNPVDIVCSLKDKNGNKFDLNKFVNENTGIITYKTIAATPIKVLEMPGLWNGSMYFWNTYFVEIPLYNFNPVKEVNDLLKERHQPKIKKADKCQP